MGLPSYLQPSSPSHPWGLTDPPDFLSGLLTLGGILAMHPLALDPESFHAHYFPLYATLKAIFLVYSHFFRPDLKIPSDTHVETVPEHESEKKDPITQPFAKPSRLKALYVSLFTNPVLRLLLNLYVLRQFWEIVNSAGRPSAGIIVIASIYLASWIVFECLLLANLGLRPALTGVSGNVPTEVDKKTDNAATPEDNNNETLNNAANTRTTNHLSITTLLRLPPSLRAALATIRTIEMTISALHLIRVAIIVGDNRLYRTYIWLRTLNDPLLIVEFVLFAPDAIGAGLLALSPAVLRTSPIVFTGSRTGLFQQGIQIRWRQWWIRDDYVFYHAAQGTSSIIIALMGVRAAITLQFLSSLIIIGGQILWLGLPVLFVLWLGGSRTARWYAWLARLYGIFWSLCRVVIGF